MARAVPKVFRAASLRRPRIQATMTTNVFYFSFIPEKERHGRHGKTGEFFTVRLDSGSRMQQVFMIRLPPIVQDGNFWAVVADSTTEGWWKFLKNSASGSSLSSAHSIAAQHDTCGLSIVWTIFDRFPMFSFPLTLGAVFDFSIKIHFRATQEEIEEERVG